MGNPIKMPGTVTEVIGHGDGVYTIKIGTEAPAPKFRAGQFLHLSVDAFDPTGGFWPESRVFSIASRWGMPGITIVYSARGRYTRRMERELVPGKPVWLKLPFGSFLMETKSIHDRDLLLIAGGTGITPFIPLLEESFSNVGDRRRIVMHYGVRNTRHVLFRDLLERGLEGGLDLTLKVEHPDESSLGRLGNCVSVGRLDFREIGERRSDWVNPLFFLSGPPAMIEYFRTGLASEGFDASSIHTDEWE